MNSAFSKLIPKRQKTRLNIKPFVYEYRPFVCFTFSGNMPFIREKLPLIPNLINFRQSSGFTLVELVVAMAVAAILVIVAVPNIQSFIQNGRLITQTNDLIGDLSLARSEAIKRRTNVGICKSTDGITCAGGGDWEDGRAIFVDLDNDSTWDAGEPILRFRERLASTADSLSTNAVLGDPIIFTANGASSSVALGGPAGTFTFCDYRGASKGKLITLNLMGQVSVSANPPGAC